MATATKSKSSSSSKSTKSGSSSTKAKSTDSLAKKIAADVHAKRESYDNPPVDTPIPIEQNARQAESVDEGKTIDFVLEGPTVTVSIGKEKVVLDREGILASQRHFNAAGANV